MRSGSAVTQSEEGKKKYNIYVEDYVLSYLRREADSLELSEIYFYGSRQDGGRKIFVYGAGRDKGIEAFAQYEPLSELMCRLTQAGPVFMVRESNGECHVNGFQVFYENNEAMQSYLLEWTGSAEPKGGTEKHARQEESLPVLVSAEKKPQKEVHGAISVQLCLILMVLTAIVITSTDSYDKMQQLNQSAKEVFFAIENQEAEDNAEESVNAEKRDEIVVERDVTAARDLTEQAEEAESPAGDLSEESEDTKPDMNQTENAAATEDKPEEGLLESVQEEPSEEGADQKQDTPSDEEEEKESGQEEKDSETEEPEEGEEALSRNVTRYYEVEQGDTLYTISQKIYGDFSRVEKICEINQITDPDKIRSGQRIILP